MPEISNPKDFEILQAVIDTYFNSDILKKKLIEEKGLYNILLKFREEEFR